MASNDPASPVARFSDEEESLLLQFESAWERGAPPNIAAICPTPSLHLLLELILIDLERRTKAGLDPRVEMYLKQFPALKTHDDDVFSLLTAERRLRKENLRPAELEEYQRRFPHLAGRLKDAVVNDASPRKPTDSTLDPSQPNARKPNETEIYRDKAGDDERIDVRELLAPPQGEGELGRLAQYRVLKELGRGGMGMVLLAEDAHLRRMAALKIMLPKYAQNSQARDRFLREARAAAKLQHDNIVTIFQVGVGEQNAIPFIAMEFLKGESLDQYMKEKGELQIGQTIRIGRETAEGLQAAHSEGLIHRDIKPANVWLEAPKGRVKILDFGLAREQNDDIHLTKSGAVVGTPAYMAPEQARGEAVDARTDLWSLGVVLYRLCTGKLPFNGPSTMAVLMSIGVDKPVPARKLNPQMPAALEGLIHLLLSKDPAKRPPSAQDVVDALIDIEKPGAGTPKVVTEVVYVPLATQLDNSPFAGIDDSDYENPKVANDAQRAGSRQPPVNSTDQRAGLRKRPVNSNDERAGPRQRPVGEREDTGRLRNPARLVLLGIGVLALLVGGFFAIRNFTKDDPKPEAKVPEPSPKKVVQPAPKTESPIVAKTENPPPSVPKRDWPGSLDIGPGGLKIGADGLPRLTIPFTPGEAKQAQEAWAKKLGKKVVETIDLGDGVTLAVVLIPPGKFLMGSSPEENGHNDNEDLHPVEISRPFYLGKYEVTQKQFEQVIGHNPSEFSPAGNGKDKIGVADTSQYPVENVNWDGAMKFGKGAAQRFVGIDKGRGGLPSEAQWQWACRAGTSSRFYFGGRDEMLAQHGNMSDAARKRADPSVMGSASWDDGYPFTAPVGKYKPNAFGLYDMSGNVWELCEDYYGPYTVAPADGMPQLVKQMSDFRVRRGGTWGGYSNDCRSARRQNIGTSSRDSYIGFRVVILPDSGMDKTTEPKVDSPRVVDSTKADPDRNVAELLLPHVGSLTLRLPDGKEQQVRPGDNLPAVPFALVVIDMDQKPHSLQKTGNRCLVPS